MREVKEERERNLNILQGMFDGADDLPRPMKLSDDEEDEDRGRRERVGVGEALDEPGEHAHHRYLRTIVSTAFSPSHSAWLPLVSKECLDTPYSDKSSWAE